PRFALREVSVSVPDGAGSRSVVARLQDQYGVWHAILVLCNDQAGVKDGFMRPMSRQEWTERLQRLETQGAAQAVVPTEFAQWQVAEARRLNDATGFPLGDSLKEWDALVGPPPPGYEPPDPIAPVLAASEEQRREWVEAGARLFKQSNIGRWFLEAADCAPFARRWSDLQVRLRHRGRTPELQQEEEKLLQETVETLLTEEWRGLFRGRLAHAARIFEWSGQEALARQAAAVVADLDAGTAPRDNPFFKELARRSLQVTETLILRGEDLERLRYKPMKRYQS
ncbi:MAG TPA: hypothetical protein VFU47_12530, partial [Armatimonadota bacterium]|nr:hypothetical protein [Armatimonadota bacterium]